MPPVDACYSAGPVSADAVIEIQYVNGKACRCCELEIESQSE